MDKDVAVPQALEVLVRERYREELDDVLLGERDYTIKPDNTKYDKKGNVLPFEGVTTVANVPGEHALYKFVSKLIGRIKGWQEDESLATPNGPILATVPIDSAHVTTYDTICKADWLDKYKKQFNDETKEEIAALVKKHTRGKGDISPQNDFVWRQAAYEVIARRIVKALQGFSASRAPVFKPIGIAAFPPHSVTDDEDVPLGKGLLIFNMGPKDAEDLAIITKMQDAIRDATGIKNFGAFKAHMTLGYFVNEAIGSTLKRLKEFTTDLDNDIRNIADNEEYEFTMESIEVSYFNDMDSFPSIASFSWTDGTYNRSEGGDVVKRLLAVKKPFSKASSAGGLQVGAELEKIQKTALGILAAA